MRTRLVTLLLLAGLALQPAMAGPWGHQEQRREPPRPQQQHMQQQMRPPEPPRQQMFAPPQRPQGQGVSRDEAMRRAQQMNGGGRILAADPAESGYRVRVLKDGEVRSVYVPGQ